MASKRLKISWTLLQPPEEVESILVCLRVVAHVDIGWLFVGGLCEAGEQVKASRNVLIGSSPEYSVQSMTWFLEESIYSRCLEGVPDPGRIISSGIRERRGFESS